MQIPDDLPTQHPEVVHATANCVGGKSRRCQMQDEGPQAKQKPLTRRQVFSQSHPRTRPAVQIAAIAGNIGGRAPPGGVVYSGSFVFDIVRAMELTTIPQPLPSPAGVCRFARPLQRRQEDRRGERGASPAHTVAVCSGCHRPGPGYDRLPESPSETISFGESWFSFCTGCGVSIAQAVASRWRRFRG